MSEKSVLFCIFIKWLLLFCYQSPFNLPHPPFFFHPDCCEGIPGQCIHQAATNSHLTFVYRT